MSDVTKTAEDIDHISTLANCTCLRQAVTCARATQQLAVRRAPAALTVMMMDYIENRKQKSRNNIMLRHGLSALTARHRDHVPRPPLFWQAGAYGANNH